jgi:hypothetical protein
MKKLLTAILLCAFAALSGCDDKDARDYANELAGVLKTYQSEVNRKIGAERASYKDLASTYAYARQVDLYTTLQNERLRRSGELADALLQGEKALSPSDIQALVADYARHDFDATRETLEQESDGQAEYLASLESLELQADGIENLSKALQELGKPKSDIKQLKELASAAKQFKEKFDALECEDLARQINCLKEQLKKTPPNKQEKVQAEIDRLSDQMKDKGCSADLLNSVKCPDKKGA